jgi:hypothetical protein
VVHTCNPSYTGEGQRSGGSWFKASLGTQFARFYPEKYPTQKMAILVAQVVEHLLSKCEALSSNSTTDFPEISS